MLAMIELPLRDIHLPQAISWWPPAAGFWIAAAVALICTVSSAWVLWIYLRPSLQKSARKELKRIEARFMQQPEAAVCLAELSQWLRRVVLSQKLHPLAAGLTGMAWLELLDKPLDYPDFSQGPGRILLKGPYRPAAAGADVHQLIQLCHKWVKRL